MYTNSRRKNETNYLNANYSEQISAVMFFTVWVTNQIFSYGGVMFNRDMMLGVGGAGGCPLYRLEPCTLNFFTLTGF